ncbi:uncharacterized [Tachysurus ichikawai]
MGSERKQMVSQGCDITPLSAFPHSLLLTSNMTPSQPQTPYKATDSSSDLHQESVEQQVDEELRPITPLSLTPHCTSQRESKVKRPSVRRLRTSRPSESPATTSTNGVQR